MSDLLATLQFVSHGRPCNPACGENPALFEEQLQSRTTLHLDHSRPNLSLHCSLARRWPRFFTFKKAAEAVPCDIEAGLQPAHTFKETRTDIHYYESMPAACFLIPVKDGFVEIDLGNEPTASSNLLTRQTTQSVESDPVESSAADTTLKEVRDRIINAIKSVIVSPGVVTTTPCSAEVEYVNLRILGNPNRQIRFSKQSFAELSIIQRNDGDSSSDEEKSVESESVKTLILPRSATVRYVKRLPKYKLRAVQFALPPIEIPDVFSSYEVEPKRSSDIFDLLDQFPTPPASVEPVLSPPTVSPEKPGRFARRYCIYRKADVGDVSMSSSGCDATVLSISVSGDTMESSALETPDTGNFLPGSFTAGHDPFAHSSPLVTRPSDDLNDSPTKITILPTILYDGDQQHSLDAHSNSISTKGHIKRDANLDLDLGLDDANDSNSAEETDFPFSYKLRKILTASSSDGSSSTVDQLRAQLEEHTYDSIKRPHSLVWPTDRNLAEDSDARNTRGLAIEKAQSNERLDLTLTEDENSLEDVLKAIRDTEADDHEFQALFWRNTSFCRSSLANKANPRLSMAPGRISLQHFNRGLESRGRPVEEILAILNLPDPIEAAAEDSTWAMSSDGMSTDIACPSDFLRAMRNDDSIDDHAVEDLFTWLAMNSTFDEDDRKEANTSEDDDEQWHDAVLDLDMASQ